MTQKEKELLISAGDELLKILRSGYAPITTPDVYKHIQEYLNATEITTDIAWEQYKLEHEN